MIQKQRMKAEKHCESGDHRKGGEVITQFLFRRGGVTEGLGINTFDKFVWLYPCSGPQSLDSLSHVHLYTGEC